MFKMSIIGHTLGYCRHHTACSCLRKSFTALLMAFYM